MLLDEPDMGFSDATDVAFTPDGRYALVTSSGTDRVAVVDIEKLLSLVQRTATVRAPTRAPEPPRQLDRVHRQAHSHREEPARHPGHARDRRAWVANTLDDSLSVIDLAKME